MPAHVGDDDRSPACALNPLDRDIAKCDDEFSEGLQVRIIAKNRLPAMAMAHGDCVDQVTRWYRTASKEQWASLADIRETYRSADLVGDRTVFNIKGNDYRLIGHIHL